MFSFWKKEVLLSRISSFLLHAYSVFHWLFCHELAESITCPKNIFNRTQNFCRIETKNGPRATALIRCNCIYCSKLNGKHRTNTKLIWYCCSKWNVDGFVGWIRKKANNRPEESAVIVSNVSLIVYVVYKWVTSTEKVIVMFVRWIKRKTFMLCNAMAVPFLKTFNSRFSINIV